MSRVDVKDLIGIPFLDEGRDPSVGLDCWGLFLLAQKKFGNEVPDFTVRSKDSKEVFRAFSDEIATSNWKRIEKPVPGCAVVMAMHEKHPNLIQHFGVYIGNGKFLHTTRKISSCVARIYEWKGLIRGYYAWNG